ncbi:MAG TPA: serine hydrolase [Bryobacteraceae bacterium]|jgi:CubicO group peptidase (beta-lactamase class C family)|nr:serine hydrolase [Bryobacteraceae bacterium]
MNPNIFQSLTVPGTDEIREILVRRIDHQKQAAGIVVGIIEPTGRRVVAYGNLAKGDPRTVDGDTIFEIGSVTKVFTSLVLADMVSRKEVALDDPAAKYLPETVKMPERNGKSITLLDLSTHSSGLPALPVSVKPEADYSMEDLYQFLSGYTLPRDPGSEYEYSNLGAGLLGHLLACRAGTDYESLIRSRIARPLGMPDTGITFSSSRNQHVATGHNAMLEPVANSDLPTPLAGAGALRSSANDMLTFLEAFLGYKESPLAPAMKAMLEVRRPAGQATIGLGWIIMSAHGREIVGHNGATGGFRSFVGYAPNERIGAVVLSNASTPSGIDDIGFHLLNPNAPLANPEPPEQRTEIRIDPRLLDNYTGRYQVAPNLIFEITRDGDRLFAQGFAQLPHNRPGDLTGLPKFELFAEGEKNFFARVADHQFTFETGSEGRARSLILHRAGRDMPGARLP